MPPHLLTNLEMQRYYQNESRFNGINSRDNLLDQIKDEPYLINLYECVDIGTHWIAFYSNSNTKTYFGSFRVNTFQKKSRSSSRVIDFMLKSKSLTDFTNTNLFSPKNFQDHLK